MTPMVAAEVPSRSLAFEVENAETTAWVAVGTSYLILVERIESRFAEAGLPGLAWLDVLAGLEALDGPARPRDLLCQVRVTKSGLTRLLDRIEREGLIERSKCPSDRRGTFLTITGAGRETLGRMLPIRAEVFRKHFESVLTEEESIVVAEALDRVTDSVRAELESDDCEPV